MEIINTKPNKSSNLTKVRQRPNSGPIHFSFSNVSALITGGCNAHTHSLVHRLTTLVAPIGDYLNTHGREWVAMLTQLRLRVRAHTRI